MAQKLRMSATGRSYTQIFFKFQHIIIQAILSRKSMKKFTVTNEKIFRVYKAFDGKKKQSYGFEDFPRTVFGKRKEYITGEEVSPSVQREANCNA